MAQTVGIAGLGAIGSAVGRALNAGIQGLEWIAASDIIPNEEFTVPLVSFEELAERCDIIVEALPPTAVPELANHVLKNQKTLILISSCALLMFPEILDTHKDTNSRIIVPSGALAGIDGVKALKELGIEKSIIASTKHPRGFIGAPYVEEMGINLDQIKTKTKIFEGNALQASKGFPANVNVAATLSLAGIGPEKTMVEIWADPNAIGNNHEITVSGKFSTLNARIENKPDPANPKSSVLAAQSIVSVLKDTNNAVVIL
ncbi:MAG: aspartate dehydrogenase domain-containing protein [Alphaproteobacteria bacterium]